MSTSSMINNVFRNRSLNKSLESMQRSDLDHLDFINRQMKFNDVPVEAKVNKLVEKFEDNDQFFKDIVTKEIENVLKQYGSN